MPLGINGGSCPRFPRHHETSMSYFYLSSSANSGLTDQAFGLAWELHCSLLIYGGQIMGRWISMLGSLLIFLGCAEVADLETSAPESLRIKSGSQSCSISMCLTGAMSHDTPSNRHFAELCADSRMPSLHQDCWWGDCHDTFDSFLQFPLLSVYPSLLDALDRTGDGRIDEDDPVCSVNLIGFSWGGVNAISLAHHMQFDPRVPDTHKIVSKIVLLDAFQPVVAHNMAVPENVESVLSIRHSQASRDDCSGEAPLGPYLGIAPVCSSSTSCADFDVTAEPNTLYELDRIGYRRGDEIGHCLIPLVSHEPVLAYLNDQPYAHHLPAPQ